jgi:LmbE family N-acetylglucosaminyl deacetylase
MALIVYATPHQDDETLAMGGSIRLHLEAGHDVHVLLMSSGVNSGVRGIVGLDRPEFTDARDDEMFRACRQLGVRFRNVHVSRHTTEDGELAVDDAEDAMRGFVNAHPGAWVKTYSHLPANGRHQDHINAGQAAVNLATAGTITNLRLYIEPWLRDNFTAAHPGVTLSTNSASNTAAVVAALDEYRHIDHVGGKYGIGYQSVRSAFDLVRADPVSWYHLPPS